QGTQCPGRGGQGLGDIGHAPRVYRLCHLYRCCGLYGTGGARQCPARRLRADGRLSSLHLFPAAFEKILDRAMLPQKGARIMAIEKVAVLGSGVMGSGIAAQIANAGVPVVLLDIVPSGAADRNMLAKGAIEKMLKADPAPFMSAKNAKLITPGNLEDDLALLKECDWVCEVVLEDIAVKHA